MRLPALRNKWRLFLFLLVAKRPGSGEKVLLIIRNMETGGAEKVSLDIIGGLNKKGYRVCCISTVPADNKLRSAFKKQCFSLVDLPASFPDMDAGWFVTKYIEALGIKKIITSNNFLGYQVAKEVKTERQDVKVFDILHGQGGKHEGGGWPKLSEPYDKYIDKRVVITEYLRNYLIKHHSVKRNRIVVIHNGIDLDLDKSPPSSGVFDKLNGKFIVLWAGRFSPEKHPELVIRTAELVAKKNDRVHFVIIGEGQMKTQLETLIKDRGLNNVSILKAYTDFRPYMSGADVLFVTSEMEGLPLVILESFLMNTPVVAASVGGIPEIVEDSKNGYLVSYRSLPIKSAEKILHLAGHPKMIEKLGIRGHDTVNQKFSLTKMIDEYDKVLSS